MMPNATYIMYMKIIPMIFYFDNDRAILLKTCLSTNNPCGLDTVNQVVKSVKHIKSSKGFMHYLTRVFLELKKSNMSQYLK